MGTLGAYSKIFKAAADVFGGDGDVFVFGEVGMYPAVSVGGVFVMAALHELEYPLPFSGEHTSSGSPFVVTATRYPTKQTQLLYREFLRERFDDRVFFSDTGTN